MLKIADNLSLPLDAVTQKLLVPCEWHAHAIRLRALAADQRLSKEDRLAIATALVRIDRLERRLEHAQWVLRGESPAADVIPFKRPAEPDDFTFSADPDGGRP